MYVHLLSLLIRHYNLPDSIQSHPESLRHSQGLRGVARGSQGIAKGLQEDLSLEEPQDPLMGSSPRDPWKWHDTQCRM